MTTKLFENGEQMRSSALTSLLFNSGLPSGVYDFVEHSTAEGAAMAARLLDQDDAILTAAPSVTMVEIEAEQCLYLITQAGHFAHPSILQRSLVTQGQTKSIRTSGWTAAGSALMSTWLDQFRQQDMLSQRAFLE